MIFTSITYLFLQGPGFYMEEQGVTKSSKVAAEEKPWALAGAVMCFVLFAAYMRYQAMVGASEEEIAPVDGMRSLQLERRSSVTQTYMNRGDITLRGVMQKELLGLLDEDHGSSINESTSLNKKQNSKILKKLEVRLFVISLLRVCFQG